jgi:cobalt-zinc-cadmium efflux system protein
MNRASSEDEMGHGHDHSHGHAHGVDPRRALAWALGLNGGFLVIEAAVGFATGSLALLSDAAHMLSDVGALVLALVAAQLATVPRGGSRTYGLARAEVLGAFVNGLTLLLACGWIGWEAIERLRSGAPRCPAGR